MSIGRSSNNDGFNEINTRQIDKKSIPFSSTKRWGKNDEKECAANRMIEDSWLLVWCERSMAVLSIETKSVVLSKATKLPRPRKQSIGRDPNECVGVVIVASLLVVSLRFGGCARAQGQLWVEQNRLGRLNSGDKTRVRACFLEKRLII